MSAFPLPEATLAEFERRHDKLLERGYVDVAQHGGLRPGARVRNRGQQYTKARWDGTATLLAVMLKDPSPWAKKYGQPDVEVLVANDNPVDDSPFWLIGVWADYGTGLATGPAPLEFADGVATVTITACMGCLPKADKVLWIRLADEIDAYLDDDKFAGKQSLW